MIGKTLQNGKYEIKRVLGQGGFGITYEGVQTGLGRKVAIKEFFMKDFCERETGTSQVTIVSTEGNRTLVERFKEKFIKEAQMIAGLARGGGDYIGLDITDWTDGGDENKHYNALGFRLSCNAN